MSTISRYKPLVARVLLSLWVALFGNSVIFRHSHRLANGTIITHAHPYKSCSNGPFQPNTHTEQQLYWLDGVSNPLIIGFAWPVFAFLLVSVCQGSTIYQPYVIRTLSVAVGFWGRGPPLSTPFW